MAKCATYYSNDDRITKYITDPLDSIVEKIDNAFIFEKLKDFFKLKKNNKIFSQIRHMLMTDNKNLVILSSILQLDEANTIKWIINTYPTEIDNKFKFCLKRCRKQLNLYQQPQ